MRGQFLVEVSPDGKPAPGRCVPDGLDQLNGWFTTWVEHEYHVRVHSSTAATPLARWSAGTPRFPGAAQLDAAFLWEAIRTVAARTATIKFQGNTYQRWGLRRVGVMKRGPPALCCRMLRWAHLEQDTDGERGLVVFGRMWCLIMLGVATVATHMARCGAPRCRRRSKFERR